MRQSILPLLGAAAMFIPPSFAWAETIVRVFNVEIVAADSFGEQTTADIYDEFGVGDLVGKPFAPTTTLDPPNASIDPRRVKSLADGCDDGVDPFDCLLELFGDLISGEARRANLTDNGDQVTFGTSNDNPSGESRGLGSGADIFTFHRGYFGAKQTLAVSLNLDPSGPAALGAPLPLGPLSAVEAVFLDQRSASPGSGEETLALGFGDASNPVAIVPEPSTWALTLLGFAGLGVAAMRRRRLRMAPKAA